MRQTTIKELGPNLPIGFLGDDGTLQKEFTARPYKARVDRHLGHWREANEGKSMAYLAGKLVAMLTQKAGPHVLALDADGDSTEEGEFAISQWFFSDVMYLYVWLRIHELDPWLHLPFKCPVCGYGGSGKFDLREATVSVAETKEDLEAWVDLQHGFKLRDGEHAKRVKLHPVKWAVLYATGTGGTQIGSIDYAQLQHSIVSVNDKDTYTPLESELDELRKIDTVKLDRACNRVSAGLDLQTSVNCPGKDPDDESGACGFEIVQALDWTYDYFFGDSFQGVT